MSYVEKTLIKDEKVDQLIKHHWWFLTETIICLGVSTLTYFLTNNTVVYYLSLGLTLIFSLDFIYRLIVRITTEQALTNKRVFIKWGLIIRNTDELINKKIETVSISQGIFGRLLNFGDIEFTGTGGIFIEFKFVPNPTVVKRNFEQV